MKKWNSNLYPTGGRYFIDEDGIKHRDSSWDLLARRVASYRKRAGKPPGDPAAEIQAQVCARLPHYCVEQEAPSRPSPRPVRAAIGSGALTERALKWLAGVLSERRAGGAGTVSRAVAAQRARICAGCPFNRGLNQSCGQCNNTRKEAAKALVEGGQRVNSRLGGCQVLGVDNSVAVHLDLPRDNREGLPGHCWRRG